jgi:hypothetical protein
MPKMHGKSSLVNRPADNMQMGLTPTTNKPAAARIALKDNKQSVERTQGK